MGFLFLIIPLALGVLALEVTVVYYLTRRFRFRLAVRTWWLVLYAELFLLVWVPPLKWPLLVNFAIYKSEGFWYLPLLVLDTREILLGIWQGLYPDFRLLLLPPLVPALVALGFDYRRNRRPTDASDPLRPSSTRA